MTPVQQSPRCRRNRGRRFTARAPVLVLALAGLLCGTSAAAGDPALAELLKRLDASRRANQKITVLADIEALGPKAAPAVPKLLPLLESDEWTLQLAAVRTLMATGAAAKPALPIYIRLLDSRRRSLRSTVTRAIGRLGADAVTAVPALLLQIRRDERLMNRTVASALAEIGAPAAPALVNSLDDRERLRVAVEALRRMKGAALPSLRAGLKAESIDARLWCVVLLRDLGPGARSALDDLSALNDSPWLGLAEASRIAAARIDPTRRSIPGVLDALHRIAAAEARWLEAEQKRLVRRRKSLADLRLPGLEGLHRAGLIDATLATGEAFGYRFRITVSKEKPAFLWYATASPLDGKGPRFAINFRREVRRSDEPIRLEDSCLFPKALEAPPQPLLVVQMLRGIGEGQVLFRGLDRDGDGKLHFGTLPELVKESFVSPTLRDGEAFGYRFKVVVDKADPLKRWYGIAEPAGAGGRLPRFFINETGRVLYSRAAISPPAAGSAAPEGLRPVAPIDATPLAVDSEDDGTRDRESKGTKRG